MSKNRRGALFVLSGPSAVGKGTLCRALLSAEPNLCCSTSATTRQPRRGEVNGREYFFLTEEEFIQKEQEGYFLESASSFGNHYGTPKCEVERLQAEGRDVILEIDTQGAWQVRENHPEAVLIFVEPPTLEDLRIRMEKRNSEGSESMASRLGRAEEELAQADRYDYRVVNDTVETAVARLRDIYAEVTARLMPEER